MRGNPKNQATQILLKVFRTHTSRHDAKKRIRREAGRPVSSNEMGKQMKITSYGSYKQYKKKVASFLTWAKDTHGIKDANLVNPEHVAEFLQEKVAAGVSRSTVNVYASAFEKMRAGLIVIYGDREDWTAQMQNAKTGAKKFKHKPRALKNPEQIIAKMPDGKAKVAAQLQYESGVRIDGATKVTEKALYAMDGSELKENQLCINGKGGRRVVVVISPELYKKIRSYMNNDERNRFQVSQQTYIKHLKDAVEAVGEKWTGSHGMRWTFAQIEHNRLREDGWSEDDADQAVSYKLGHSRSSITKHYLKR